MTQVIPESKNRSPFCICAENYLYKCGVFAYNEAEMDFKKILFFKPWCNRRFSPCAPLLTALKKKFPAAQVTVVVTPEVEPLILGTHLADSVLVFDKSFLKKRFRHFLDFGLGLRRQHYDLVVDMQPSLRSLVLRLLMGAKRTLVYRKQKKVRRGERRLHAAENFMVTLRPIGIHDRVEEISLPVKPEAREVVGRFLSQQGVEGDSLLIALNCSVGAARPARTGIPSVSHRSGTGWLKNSARQWSSWGRKEDRDIVAGRHSVDEEQGYFCGRNALAFRHSCPPSRCACLVSSDTGPLHLATAVHTPVVGPTAPRIPGARARWATGSAF